MSNPITIQDLTLGNANSVEDPKILANFAAIKAWIQTPGLQAGDLASNSVTTAKIADSTGSSDGVTTAKIATGAVTNAKVASDAIKTDNIAANEVSSSKIRLFTVPKYVTTLPTSWSGTVNFTSGSTSVTVASTTSGSITVGTKLSLTSGSGIPSDAIVTAYSGSTITLNRAATATSTGVAATTAPQTGDEVYYPADSTNSVIWHLRYRASADGGNSTYPWEFVGGPPLYSSGSDRSGEVPSSARYADYLGSPFTLTLPALSGVYTITHGSMLKTAQAATGAATAQLLSSISVGPSSFSLNQSGVTSSSPGAGGSLTLNTTSGLPSTGQIIIDTEAISYTGISGNDITGVGRAAGGTTAASHTTGTTAYSYPLDSDSVRVVLPGINNAATAASGVITTRKTITGPSAVIRMDWRYATNVPGNTSFTDWLGRFITVTPVRVG